MDQDVASEKTSTEVGSYFIANYPPFSAWSAEHVPAAAKALATVSPKGEQQPPLGLYIHIPFCRKRCKFCYFRVYTDKNSSDVETYLDALAREATLYARQGALEGRDFEFVYFGGGTPSFLSSAQLERLVERIREHWEWESAREVTFECEPGTLKKHKLETIKAIGTTRLSLGIEHFDDEILSLNGRAHKSHEVFQSYEWAREVGFDQINIDLIAGMLGESDAKWKHTVDRALELLPDSLTIYQMELPHNTVFARQGQGGNDSPAVAGWATKRAWVDYAFQQFEQAGYVVSSAYTVVKNTDDRPNPGFVYRDSVWHGADMIGTGVASFSHFAGVHYQNVDTWDGYVDALSAGGGQCPPYEESAGELPIARALPITKAQRLIREAVLQLKLGHLRAGYFRDKFDVDIATAFAEPIASLVADGLATLDAGDMRLTRQGLLRVDGLLPRFFEPQFRKVRYT